MKARYFILIASGLGLLWLLSRRTTNASFGDITSAPNLSSNGLSTEDAVSLIDRLGSFFTGKPADGSITVYRPGQTGQTISLASLIGSPQPISNRGQEDGLLIYNPAPIPK